MDPTTQTTNHEIDHEYCARMTLAYLAKYDEKKTRSNTE